MTDIDKAFELINKLNFEDGLYEVSDALIDMAKWKDEQFAAEKKKLILNVYKKFKNMKNEDESKRIANDLADCAKGEMNKLYVSTAAYAAAMKMAELKDADFYQTIKMWLDDNLDCYLDVSVDCMHVNVDYKSLYESLAEFLKK